MGFLDDLYFSLAGKLLSKVGTTVADVDINAIQNGANGGGTFGQVYTATEQLGQDMYSVLMLIGGFGGVIMLIVAFLYFMVAGSGANKQEAKSKIIVVFIAVAGIFAAVFLVGLAQKVGDGLAGQGTVN